MNYDINYEDPKFKQVETEKQAALTENKNTYDNMINQSDKYYQDQINASKDWAQKQQELQQANTDFSIEQVNQQKDQAKKDYIKEQSGAYVDWQKQSNQYGANAEQQAAQGLANTGYSESSQVSMYNTYQNRVAIARESFNKAILNYDNAIKDAQLQNNSKLAEIAYKALQTQLELSLQGFQYKNQLVLDKIAQSRSIDSEYYNRYQDVLNQMNKEKSLAEQIRQYNEAHELDIKKYNESIRQFNEEMARQREKDKSDNDYRNKQLEQAQRQWQAEYNLSKQKLGSSSTSKSSSINKSTSNTSTSLVSKPSSAPNNYSTPGVGQNTYDETLKNIRLMTSAAMSKKQKQKIAEDMLARSRFSDEQIEKALKSLGLN